MSFLARKVRGNLWAQAEDADRWLHPEFPYELLADLSEKEGHLISVWEVSTVDDPNLQRVAAALTVAGTNKEIQSMEFRLTPRVDVEALGITVTSTDGGTSDASINRLHRELSRLTSQQAVELLRLMRPQGRAFSAKAVARSLAEGLVSNRLPREVINQALLWSLNRQGAVSIIVPP
jgi:hypothetical protein